ncbi:hypothetical protein VDF76_16270 [Xanthomonas campestris pv. raphani]|uniref:hypothetical protein n=1 Tax=Xanthomonas campestris TaxID=339 RepID=UPI002B229881|nr:hypothetical protein [Xanthomonas campestris]MEA9748523.1 hypothetical protein [Xanthomonas campestris pv. raphani]MEA9848703.1 hypothetical protein [Xanthomonas campestris pv. raphani]MEA9930579.1 hypothetical protein [Xanthomonas campestris pv. raphani]
MLSGSARATNIYGSCGLRFAVCGLRITNCINEQFVDLIASRPIGALMRQKVLRNAQHSPRPEPIQSNEKWRRHAERRATYQLPSTQQKLRQPVDRRSQRIAAISA